MFLEGVFSRDIEVRKDINESLHQVWINRYKHADLARSEPIALETFAKLFS